MSYLHVRDTQQLLGAGIRLSACGVHGWDSMEMIAGHGIVNAATAAGDSHPVESDDLAVDAGELKRVAIRLLTSGGSKIEGGQQAQAEEVGASSS